MSLSSRLDPARNAYAITPSDSVALPSETRAIYCGGGGNIAVQLAEDSAAVTFAGVVAGSMLPIAAKQVNATGTTATLLIALR